MVTPIIQGFYSYMQFGAQRLSEVRVRARWLGIKVWVSST